MGGLGALNVLVISKTQVVLCVGGKSKFPDVKLLKNHLIQIFLKQDFQAIPDINVEQRIYCLSYLKDVYSERVVVPQPLELQ